MSLILTLGLPSDPHQVLVLTYDLVKKLPAQTAARFGVVICDESHHLKNKDAQRTQAVSTLVRGAAVAVLITGTPLLSRPIEIWSQVRGAQMTELMGPTCCWVSWWSAQSVWGRQRGLQLPFRTALC